MYLKMSITNKTVIVTIPAHYTFVAWREGREGGGDVFYMYITHTKKNMSKKWAFN